MKGYRSATFVFVLVAVAAVCGFFFFQLKTSSQVPAHTTLEVQPAIERRSILVGGQTVQVDVVDTEAAREKGLGGRDGLAPNEGMLFVFPQPGKYAFWMKDMKFSIDILWLTSEGKVIYIQPSLSPDTFPSAFGPDSESRYVLELPAGFAQHSDISVGDVVKL